MIYFYGPKRYISHFDNLHPFEKDVPSGEYHIIVGETIDLGSYNYIKDQQITIYCSNGEYSYTVQ